MYIVIKIKNSCFVHSNHEKPMIVLRIIFTHTHTGKYLETGTLVCISDMSNFAYSCVQVNRQIKVNSVFLLRLKGTKMLHNLQ